MFRLISIRSSSHLNSNHAFAQLHSMAAQCSSDVFVVVSWLSRCLLCGFVGIRHCTHCPHSNTCDVIQSAGERQLQYNAIVVCMIQYSATATTSSTTARSRSSPTHSHSELSTMDAWDGCALMR